MRCKNCKHGVILYKSGLYEPEWLHRCPEDSSQNGINCTALTNKIEKVKANGEKIKQFCKCLEPEPLLNNTYGGLCEPKGDDKFPSI